MNSNISIKDNEFYFTKKNREGIKDVQMLADILETFRKEYFHFKDPITLAELKKLHQILKIRIIEIFHK